MEKEEVLLREHNLYLKGIFSKISQLPKQKAIKQLIKRGLAKNKKEAIHIIKNNEQKR